MNDKNHQDKALFARSINCGGKTYDLETFEASSGSWFLRVRETSHSGKRKGQFDVIVYAEYLPQFLDAVDAVRRHIESESSGTMTA